MDTNNILHKSSLNHLAQEFIPSEKKNNEVENSIEMMNTTPENDVNINLENTKLERNKKIFMDTNNILHKSSLNHLAQEFIPSEKKNNEVENSIEIMNTTPENAKEFTLSIPIKHKTENHVMDVNINLENAELERNKKIFMDTNNILHKSSLNHLAQEFIPSEKKNNEVENSIEMMNTTPENAKEFTLSIPIKHKTENHVMDVNINLENAELERNKKIFMDTNNILHKSSLNHLAQEFIPSEKKNNEVENSIEMMNTTPENAKEFTLPIPIKHKTENHVMDVNINLENVSKQFLENYMEQMAAWHHKTYKSRFPIDIIAPQNYKIKPLEKKFTLLIQIKLKTENHIMDININFKNVSKQVLENYMRQQMVYNQNTVKNRLPQNITPPYKVILKPLTDKITPSLQISDGNKNHVEDINCSPENESKELNEMEQNPSNHNIEENPSEKYFAPRHKANFIIHLSRYCFKKMRKLFHNITRLF
ncbi:metacaspase-2-like isoform X2 [Aphis gossypii]|uniref:metacaspase-2-like isoform X2 n=1 Tax=Aphis gossypii TaxID=80765 RepID=UPI002159B02E|nr:metacaspase-2-like isoform X2 [Aphis gossypii]